MKTLFPAALLLLCALPARAFDIPRVDFERTCRDTPPVSMDKDATYRQCMADEKQARDQLADAWPRASDRARQQCGALTRLGGQSSYVELITCLEMENPDKASAPAGAANFRNPHPQPTAGTAPAK